MINFSVLTLPEESNEPLMPGTPVILQSQPEETSPDHEINGRDKPVIKNIEDPKYVGQAIKIAAKLLIKIKLEAKKKKLSVREDFHFLRTHIEYEKAHTNDLNNNFTRLGLEFNLALDHR